MSRRMGDRHVMWIIADTSMMCTRKLWLISC